MTALLIFSYGNTPPRDPMWGDYLLILLNIAIAAVDFVFFVIFLSGKKFSSAFGFLFYTILMMLFGIWLAQILPG